MTPPDHLHLTRCRDVAEALAAALAQTGVRHEAFVDQPFCQGPAPQVDLFEAFSRHSRQSIRLRECLLAIGPRAVGVYLVPVDRVPPFLDFLRHLIVDMPDGRCVRPVCSPPGGPQVCGYPDEGVRAALSGCHVVAPAIFPANHPYVRAWRRSKAGPRRAGLGRRAVRQQRSPRGGGR